MTTTTHGVPLLAGAKISLGEVNITGKKFTDYSVAEVAYIVGRYMQQNAEAGGVFYGAIFTVLHRLWPEEFEDPSGFSQSKFAKQLYYWMKQFGFKNKRSSEWGTIWYLPGDIDANYSTRMAKSSENPKEIPAPVTSWCLCGAGPYHDRAEFKKHHAEAHEQQEVIVEPIVEKKSRKAKKVGPRQKQVLTQMLKQEGLHPREYAERIGGNLTTGAISSAFMGLRQLGLVFKTGNVQSSRYFLTDTGRETARSFSLNEKRRGGTTKKANAIEQPQLPLLEEKVVEAPQAEPVMNIPVGMNATIYETKDGSWIVVTTEGKTYFVNSVHELAK